MALFPKGYFVWVQNGRDIALLFQNFEKCHISVSRDFWKKKSDVGYLITLWLLIKLTLSQGRVND